MLRISDREGLAELLAPLAPEARKLHWSVLDLGEVMPGAGRDLPDPWREPRVDRSPTGWQLTFEELTAFAGWVGQVIDGVFVACDTSANLPSRTDTDHAILEQADMLVAAIDSSFWLLSAPETVLARAEQTFQHVSEVEPSTVSLSTWGRDY